MARRKAGDASGTIFRARVSRKQADIFLWKKAVKKLKKPFAFIKKVLIFIYFKDLIKPILAISIFTVPDRYVPLILIKIKNRAGARNQQNNKHSRVLSNWIRVPETNIF
jgi:hypothetical protein